MHEEHVDIVVIGGGISGFAAAMGVPESKSVMLIERDETIGGNSVRANVGTICGAHYRSFSGKPHPVTHPFVASFLQKLQAADTKFNVVNHQEGLYFVPYEWTILERLMQDGLARRKVVIKTNAAVKQVKLAGNRINHLIIGEKGNDFQLHTKAVVDCSGKGAVTELVGAKMIQEEAYQAASQVFRVSGVNAETEYSLNMAMLRAIVKADHWPDSYRSTSVIPGSLVDHHADVKLTLPEEIAELGNDPLHQIALERVNEFFPFLKAHVTAFSQAEIEYIYPQTGIRVQQRPQGQSILTATEILSCKKAVDGVALGTWPIEEWSTSGKLTMTYFEPDNGYTIPAGCLISASISNLFFGGKGISATARAIASARVIGTCLQTGYAAGKLASAENDRQRQETIHALHHDITGR